MWMFYAFFVYGLLPLIPALKPYEGAFFYWSGWVQLWALPLIMVGNIVLNRASEERAQQDHETIMAEFKEIKQMHKEQRKENAEVHVIFNSVTTNHNHLIENLSQLVKKGR